MQGASSLRGAPRRMLGAMRPRPTAHHSVLCVCFSRNHLVLGRLPVQAEGSWCAGS